MASNVARSDDPTIVEHDVVRLLAPMATNHGRVPAGETGTVVHIYHGGEAFEIEFDAPFHVVTVRAAAVERLPG